MRKVLLSVLLLSIGFIAFSAIEKDRNFHLVLHKQGKTELYFSLYPNGGSKTENIGGLVSPDNRTAVGTTFYVGYSIGSDIFSMENDKISITLLFTASGDRDAESDFMLAKNDNPNVGLVFDYTVCDTEKNDIKEEAKKEFNAEERSKLAEIGERKVVLYDSISDSDVEQSSISGEHQVSLTIYPPGVGDNAAFTTGQYTGYVLLSVNAIS